MKILIVTGCVYAENCNRKVFTGLDYVVGEIATAVGDKCEVTVFTMTSYPKSSCLQNAKIESYRNNDLWKNVRINDVKQYIALLSSKNSFKSKIKSLKLFLVMRNIDELIKKNSYDLIHIQGASFGYFIVASLAKKYKIPVLFTLHGLLSFGNPCMQMIDKNSERLLLSMIRDADAYVTVVSEGIKDIICKKCGIKESRVVVINNAVNMPKRQEYSDVKEKYNIGTRKVILSVGTISARKNQIQLIRAYKLLPEEIRRQYIIVLAGEDATGGMVKRFVYENDLSKDVILTGFISKDELALLYNISDFNVMLSISEGFGLSMIESAYFGIPTLAFKDLDAVKDIYSSDSMILLDTRSDEAVADGIVKMTTKNWVKDKVRKISVKFDNQIYDNYYKTYESILKHKYNMFDSYVLKDYMKAASSDSFL